MLKMPTKIYVDKSPIHGWGVFAKDKILKEEVIEECPIVELPIQKGESTSLLIDYRFNFPCGEWEHQVVALGYGSIYNHSNEPNAYWMSLNDRRTFLFIANRDIEPGEEIFTYYGDVNYWNDGRSNIEIK